MKGFPVWIPEKPTSSRLQTMEYAYIHDMFLSDNVKLYNYF